MTHALLTQPDHATRGSQPGTPLAHRVGPTAVSVGFNHQESNATVVYQQCVVSVQQLSRVAANSQLAYAAHHYLLCSLPVEPQAFWVDIASSLYRLCACPSTQGSFHQVRCRIHNECKCVAAFWQQTDCCSKSCRMTLRAVTRGTTLTPTMPPRGKQRWSSSSSTRNATRRTITINVNVLVTTATLRATNATDEVGKGPHH